MSDNEFIKIRDKFNELLKLEEALNGDKFGEWVVDNKHKGTKEDPIHLPFPNYTEAVCKFTEAVYNFIENNPDYNLYNYSEILEQKGYNHIDIKTIDKSFRINNKSNQNCY